MTIFPATELSGSRQTSRQRLIETAGRLFSTRGINSTGIDVVIAEAGVAKGSMYHHFAGKQALVIAYLDAEKEAWQAGAEAGDDASLPSAERVAAIFSSVARAVDAGTFHGCPFTNAVIERPKDEEIRAVIRDYRRAVADHLRMILGVASSPALVTTLMVLYDGAITAAKLSGQSGDVAIAGDVARKLVTDAVAATGETA